MKYVHVYRLLKCTGHSPLKAGQILLDAARGDVHALSWIMTLFRIRHSVS